MTPMTIKVTAEGEVFFLYKDKHPLMDMGLGNAKMTRASNVEWNEEEQQWTVVFNKVVGRKVFKIPSSRFFVDRAGAVAYEVEALNMFLLYGYWNVEGLFNDA